MGILDRISTIVKANVHDLLDRAENPEIMLDQYIRDLESAVGEAREELVTAMADEKRLASKLQDRKRQAQQWEEKAEQAVKAGKDEAARSALRAARAYHEEASEVMSAWEAQKARVADLQTGYSQIEEKLSTLKSQHDALLAEHKATRAKQTLTTARTNAGKASAAIRGIERMKERVEREAAKAEARDEMASMSAEVAEATRTQTDMEIEQRLAELKAKVSSQS